jgi:thymidylate kinase
VLLDQIGDEYGESLTQQLVQRLDTTVADFHEEVRKGYLSIAAEDSKRVVTIDGTCSEAEIGMRIFEHIRPFIG